MNLKELLYAVLVGVVCGACSSDVKQPVDCVDPLDRKSTRLNSSHMPKSRMPSSA